MRRDLAAVNGEERRLAVRRVELEEILARRRLRLGGAIVIERTDAGVGPADRVARRRFREIFGDGGEQIVDLAVVDRDVRRIAGEIEVGGADQRVIALVGNGEADAAIGILEDVGAVVFVKAVDDDVTAFDEADLGRRVQPDDAGDDIAYPRAAGVDQRASVDGFVARRRAGILKRQPPAVPFPARGDAARPRPDVGAAVGGVACAEDDEPRVIDPAVGIFEAAPERRLQRHAGFVVGKRRRCACRAACAHRRDDRR